MPEKPEGLLLNGFEQLLIAQPLDNAYRGDAVGSVAITAGGEGTGTFTLCRDVQGTEGQEKSGDQIFIHTVGLNDIFSSCFS